MIDRARALQQVGSIIVLRHHDAATMRIPSKPGKKSSGRALSTLKLGQHVYQPRTLTGSGEVRLGLVLYQYSCYDGSSDAAMSNQ